MGGGGSRVGTMGFPLAVIHLHVPVEIVQHSSLR